MELRNYKKITLSVSLCVLLFSGCAHTLKEADEHSLKAGENLIGGIEGKLSNQVNEKFVAKKTISIASQKSLKTVLSELQELEDNIYMLHRNSKNIDIPINEHYKIDSFEALNKYIESTSQYTIVVMKNKYRKDLPKIIKVVHSDSIAMNIKKYSLPRSITSLGASISAKDALVEVAQNIKFSLVFRYDDFPEFKNTTNSNTQSIQVSTTSIKPLSVFDNSVINFYGDNLSDFFSYIERSFNVYVDVDYSDKQILISKYKTVTKRLELTDIEISSENKESSVGAGGDGEKVAGKIISGTSTINLHKPIQDKLNAIFNGGTEQIGGLSNEVVSEYFRINSNTGDVFLVASRENMKKAIQVIDSFNESYSKSVVADLWIYEVLVYKQQKLGTSLNRITSSSKFSANSGINSFVDFVANSNSGYSPGQNGAIEIGIESVSEYGHIVRGYRATSRMTNNIPKSTQLTKLDEYVSNITDNSNVINGVIQTEISNETSSVSYGKTVTMKPSISDGICTIEVDYESISKPKLQERQIGNNNIQLVTDKSSNKYRDIARLKNGESVILNSVTDYINISDYSGIVPVENFILGGTTDGGYIKREIIYVLGINKIERR